MRSRSSVPLQDASQPWNGDDETQGGDAHATRHGFPTGALDRKSLSKMRNDYKCRAHAVHRTGIRACTIVVDRTHLTMRTDQYLITSCTDPHAAHDAHDAHDAHAISMLTIVSFA